MRILAALLLFVTSLSLAQEKPYTGKFDEPWRPAFHFTPQANWMNDPNGLVYHNGKYHMFYQYYPNDIVWGPMHWGHAESTDLMHWKHLPIALYPDSLGWIFSGSAVIDKNNTAGFGKDAMIAIFTYHNDEIWKAGKKNTESQGIAYSLDEGRTWTKYKGNPVLNNSGEQDFRDPKVFWNSNIGKWNLVLAAGDRIKIYSSTNLKQWQFESDFKPNVTEPYGVWECPDLFPMKVGDEEKWVLIISQNMNGPNGGSATRYLVGSFDGRQFSGVTGPKWIDHGTDFYAAVTYDNVPDGRRILLGWMSNWLYATKTPTKLWRSAMALPREIQLIKEGDNYRLVQKASPEFLSLTSVEISKEEVVDTLFKKEGLLLDQAVIQFDVIGNSRNLRIRLSNSANEEFILREMSGAIGVARAKSGTVDFSPDFPKVQGLLMDEPSAIRRIQLIIDRSSIEISINGGKYWMSCQVFPSKPWNAIAIQAPQSLAIKHLRIASVSSVWTK